MAKTFGVLLLSAASACIAAGAQDGLSPLLQQRWFEARTAHFNVFSCAATQQVAKLVGRLEQFRQAYSVLAGAQSVASPPIVVLAFADEAAMRPFLPLHDGKPASVTAFFHRGSDENLIALPLEDSYSLQAIFHEYTHLLFRHNERFWPLWLKEGMAEIYGSLEVAGGYSAKIGRPLREHTELLAQHSWLPLTDLFAVTHDSPDYNERDRQGVFYAESWLLTHFLMLGDNSALRPGLGQFTMFLRQGQSVPQAFTNAFRTTLPRMEQELHQYLARGKLVPLVLTVNADLAAPRALLTRSVPPVEVCFRLGDELLRINRAETAEQYFKHGQELSPQSPLPLEGLGLLAAQREQPEEAVVLLSKALQLGSTSFLAYYTCAAQKFRIASRSNDHYVTIKGPLAAEIRTGLQKSLALMPDFARAHHLLGVFELVQEEAPASAEKHLQRAIQLEPENLSYLLSLAQAEVLKGDPAAARRTLGLLLRPYVEPELRHQAEQILAETSR